MITPSAITNLQWKAYLIFMCLNFAFVPLVWCVYPETACLTLEEMDYLFTTDKTGFERSKKSLFRTEEVLRSLDHERLGSARMRHRNSIGGAAKDVENGPIVFGDDRLEKDDKGSNGTQHVDHV